MNREGEGFTIKEEHIVCSEEGQYTEDFTLRVGSEVLIVRDVEEWIDSGHERLIGYEGVICYIREDNYENFLYGVIIPDMAGVMLDFFPDEIVGVYNPYMS